jgi:hypothetical protein
MAASGLITLAAWVGAKTQYGIRSGLYGERKYQQNLGSTFFMLFGEHPSAARLL